MPVSCRMMSMALSAAKVARVKLNTGAVGSNRQDGILRLTHFAIKEQVIDYGVDKNFVGAEEESPDTYQKRGGIHLAFGYSKESSSHKRSTGCAALF